MRRAFTSLVLILAISAVAPYCVAGAASCGNECTTDHCNPHHLSSSSPKAFAFVAATPSNSRCGFRTFVSFHAVQLQTESLTAPLLVVTWQPAPAPPSIMVSSVGPPEADRGPPRS